MSTENVGTEEVETTSRIENDNQNHLSSTPYYTITILTALIAVFLSEQLISMTSVVMIAGHVKSLFANGEYWRLLTSSVVHDGILHIGFNGYALFVLGRLVESLSNKANVSIVFLISAIAGGFLSFLFIPNDSVGASGGIIGLLGFLTVYGYRRRKIISDSLLKNMLFNIVLIGIIGGLIIPNVDNYAHLGGLLAGIVYGIFQVPDDLYEDPRNATSILHFAGSGSLAIILLTCLATIAMITGWYFLTGDLFPYFDK